MSSQSFLEQVLLACLYYLALVFMMRLAGKRLAGQTTTFDLIVLISLSVVLQTTALKEGAGHALVFVGTVFICHRSLAVACARSGWLRQLVRGKPRALVRDGRLLQPELMEEAMSYEELLAGLRKLGFQSEEEVALAVIEETGHISAIAREKGR